MRIGLVSDTHMPDVAEELPSKISEVFRGVDLILHAGDIYTLPVLDELENIAPVLAAMGDDDPAALLKDKRVKNKHIIKIGNYLLWLVHERPYRPYAHEAVSETGEKVIPDIVIVGHEHLTSVQRYGNILFINPGSPTFLNYRRGPGTVGILDIDSSEVKANIVQL